MFEKTILCIDDDPFYCEFYTTLFKTKGYDIETAQDLSVGFKKAKSLSLSLIILDVMMPEKGGFFDGYGLLRELKKDPETSAVPIMMVSALDQEGDSEHAGKSGADAYLAKQDLTPDRLLREVRRLTEKKRKQSS